MPPQSYNNPEQFSEDGIRYGISVGRRQPMHIVHVDCIAEIVEAGLHPIIVIGSANGPENPNYDPAKNPLSEEQQHEQIRLAMEDAGIADYTILALEDKGHMEQWSEALATLLKDNGIEPSQSAMHFRGKEADAKEAGKEIKPLSAYEQVLMDNEISIWESVNRNPAHDPISSTPFRTMDLEAPENQEEIREVLATPDYILDQARKAREGNPDKNGPITMVDLSEARLRNEAEKTLNVKIASASLNQTVVNFTRNVPNILAAIDHAVADGADILSLQELGLTGYTGDDYFKWIRTEAQQQELIELVQYVADYANEKDPNLVVSLGFPFFYEDKDAPVKLDVGTDEAPILVDNPLYNMGNKPFNAVAMLSGGKIQAISAKSILPDGPAEYEPRQFQNWPDYLGTTEIELYDGQKVPFGKIVTELGKGEERCTIYHEICAEGWPGIYDDGTVNEREQQEGRYLNRLAEEHDISLVINPSASKPEPFLDKPGLRAKLCASGSETCNGAGYIYTNVGGLEAAPVAFEAGSIFAQNGQVTHKGERYNMADVVYSSAVMALPVPQKGTPHVNIDHTFSEHEVGLVQGASAEWESHTGKEREFEEITRNTTLWLRDYMNKAAMQGFFISLSGGQDSAFGAVMVSQMIDLNIKQLEDALDDKGKAVEAFITQFDNLAYKDEVLRVNQDEGPEAAVKCIKGKMLTCAYLPSENSSEATENAARTLIEGGVLSDGTRVEGIGGTFHVVNVQEIVDSFMEAYSGVDKRNLPLELRDKISRELKEFVAGDRDELSEDVQAHVHKRVPSWANKSDDILLQNIQARARLPVAWLFGNDEHKIACVTSNWSEAVAGYWTFGGDGHMGAINICGGVPKSDLRETLAYLETEGLHDMPPVPSLHYVNQNKASAELRPLKDGKIAQFDEDDMMPYEQLDAIARTIIIGKNSPVEAFHELKNTDETFKDGSSLFRSNEELIACIEDCCNRWHTSQFKRVAAVITPFLGQNVDPHTAVRTTILSDGFRTGRAMLKLEYLKESLGGEQEFADHVGRPFTDMQVKAKIDRGLRDALMYTPAHELKDKITEPDFGKGKQSEPWVTGGRV